MPYCSNCGNANQDNARFCKVCGLPITLSGPLTGRLNPSTLLAGRYLVERKLGQGGMGAVYLVADQRLGGKRAALKEMSDQGIADAAERAAALAAFEQEAQLLAGLEHPNLPKVTDYFEEKGNQYLVMEYVTGETLEKRLERAAGALPEPFVRKMAEQLCDVLEYLHKRQPPVIFRDLKPANIMLQADEKVKLIDFGIARHFKPGKSKDTQAMGTPGYAAPEQYGKGQSDQRTDIYALGAVLHHMLTGRDPSQDPFKFTPVQSLQPKVSAALSQVVQKAVALDQAQRWQSVYDLRMALTAQPKSTAPKPAAAAVMPPTRVMPPLARPAAPKTPSSGPAIPPPIVTNTAPGPNTLIGIPQSKPAQKAVVHQNIQRAHWLWSVFVVGAIGYWLTTPYLIQLLPVPFYRYGQLIVCMLLLAYLLTHRPLIMLLTMTVTLAIASSSYDDLAIIPWSLLLLAGSMEVLAALSLWRTRNFLFLLLMAAIGLVVYPSIIVTGVTGSMTNINVRFVDGVSPMLPDTQIIAFSLLAGVAIVWVASGIVNFFTEVGKR